MRELEHDLQCGVVQWWRVAHRGFGVPESLLFAIPNGGHRHPAVAGKLKAEGVRAGIPDMMLAVPRGRHHGLFIEHKAGTRKPGPIQNDRMQELMEQGYAVAVSYSCDKTVDIISNYLRGERA